MVSFEVPVNKISNDCKRIVEIYLDQLTLKEEERGEKAYYVEYTTTTQFSTSSGMKPTTAFTRILASNQGLMMIDENMELYGDCDNLFVVLPKLKRIFLNDADPLLYQKNNSYADQLKIQNILMDSAMEVQCQEEESEVQIKITPGKSFSNSFHLIEQRLIYNQESQSVVQVSNSYNSQSDISSQIINYQTIDYNSSREIPDPVSVLFSNSRLKAKYASFQIVDNRINY